MTALGSSPLGTPVAASHALDVLTGHAPGRRMRRLLRLLKSTTTGFGDAKLEAHLGSNVHALLKELTLSGHVERDLGDRVRLTAAGRALALKAVR